MKRKMFLAGILSTVLVFVITSCDNDTRPDASVVTNFLGGTFKNGTGSFYANRAGERNARSSVTEMLEGKVEDGDIIFNLRGFYDSSTGNFFLSAGSTFLIYEFSGLLSSTEQNASAIIRVMDTDGNWTSIDIPVIFNNQTQVGGNADARQADGLPQSFVGRWINPESNGGIVEEPLSFFAITPFALNMGIIHETLESLLDEEIHISRTKNDFEALAKQYGFNTVTEYETALRNRWRQDKIIQASSVVFNFLHIEKAGDDYVVVVYSDMPNYENYVPDPMNPNSDLNTKTDRVYLKLKFRLIGDDKIGMFGAYTNGVGEFYSLAEAEAANSFSSDPEQTWVRF